MKDPKLNQLFQASQPVAKRDISLLVWDEVDAEFVANNVSWVLPQLLAFLGTKFPLVTASGKVKPGASLKALDIIEFPSGIKTDAKTVAKILSILLETPRGTLVKRIGAQNSKAIRYAANVPLVLSAFKEYRNIPYSAWDFTDPGMKYLLEPQLQELIPYFGNCPSFSRDDLLQFRDMSKKVGPTLRNPTGITRIKETGNEDFDTLPKFLKLLLTQSWVYHPSISHSFAILNLNDLDAKAEPLIVEELLGKLETNAKYGTTLPWADL